MDLSETDLGGWLERPPEGQFGDFALPCFRLSKILQLKPNEISLRMQQILSADSNLKTLFSEVKSVGPFLNIRLNSSWLSKNLLTSILDGGELFTWSQKKQKPMRVMVEYSGLNTHKECHVGHLRNICLGDAMVRIYRYLGDFVIAANYPGDEGAHVAKCIWHIQSQNLQVPEKNRGVWLGAMYAEASRRLNQADNDMRKTYEAQISKVLHEIESKQGESYLFWMQSRGWSLEMFNEIFNWLDVRFDHEFFESELTVAAQQIVDEYLAKGVFVHSDGAIGCDLNEDKLGFVLFKSLLS